MIIGINGAFEILLTIENFNKSITKYIFNLKISIKYRNAWMINQIYKIYF